MRDALSVGSRRRGRYGIEESFLIDQCHLLMLLSMHEIVVCSLKDETRRKAVDVFDALQQPGRIGVSSTPSPTLSKRTC